MAGHLLRNLTKGGKTWIPRFIDTLDRRVCTRCGFCPKVCPAGVLHRVDDGEVVIASPEDCRGCEVCERTCKVGAIRCRPLEDKP
ncbi:MAG: 4Fe-4S ferredoxin, nitrogenase-associated [Candidatus Ozemobacter sibiricus]|jgi:MinD superfamily P-loop ATPase|uniref:4Fe-4S ferredoxin, nitrogenase-associated n=1 Tax=Candidatus Ozemobacter sibiricus TaxID=2268124 RepID=A0A367ZP27_9BACT|nr:MAG: 4Fe-4S ferredoxin, nitrogenase-associated [Candidatus Ozemobacter sibiricus]